MEAFIRFHCGLIKASHVSGYGIPPPPPHYHGHLSKFSTLSSIFKNQALYLFFSGPKKKINHFAGSRIPRAEAALTNCFRFMANDGHAFALEPGQICFLRLQVDISISHGAERYCPTARREYTSAAEDFAKPLTSTSLFCRFFPPVKTKHGA